MPLRTTRTAPDIHDNRDNRALASVNLDGNDIRCSGIKAVAMVLKTSNISNLSIANCNITWKDDGRGYTMEGAIEFSEAINANGALSKFTFSGDLRSSKPVTVEVGMTELDCSGKNLGASGAMLLATWLQHK